MPTYSYLCDACGGSFELEQRIVEDPIKNCSLCGKAQARRQIVSGNFILKGGGWYSDGYGSSKAKTPEKTETAGKAEPKVEKSEKIDSASAPAAAPPATPAKTETKASAAE